MVMQHQHHEFHSMYATPNTHSLLLLHVSAPLHGVFELIKRHQVLRDPHQWCILWFILMCTNMCLEHLNSAIQCFGCVFIVQVSILKGVLDDCCCYFDRDVSDAGQWGVDISIGKLLCGWVGGWVGMERVDKRALEVGFCGLFLLLHLLSTRSHHHATPLRTLPLYIHHPCIQHHVLSQSDTEGGLPQLP